MRIKDMPFFTQPYYRLRKNGVSSLSDAELLAIIISSGSKGENAIDTANRLLKRYNFNKLSELSLTELQKELGEVKALRLLSMFEVYRRFSKLNRKGFTQTIECAKDVFNIFVDELKDKKKEHFYVLYLDTKNRIIEKPELISIGTLNASIIHPREIFKEAVRRSANAVILVHNHPSGDCEPSAEDERITERLSKVGELMDIKVLDHVIVGEGYWSWSEK
jgi:DNA repair protein RadC